MNGENSQPSSGATGHWKFSHGDTVNDDLPERASNSVGPEDSSQVTDSRQPMLHPDDYVPDSGSQIPDSGTGEAVSWSASEFIAHHKSAGWYGLLGAGTLIVAALVFLTTKDKISTMAVLFVGAIFGISAARKPRTLGYRVDVAGLTIGQKFYAYDQFRSFAVVEEGAFSSIVFMPLKRFMPLITIYYDPKDEKKIVQLLADRLPLAAHKLDMIEQLMRRIRF
jgi:hypothetical protein